MGSNILVDEQIEAGAKFIHDFNAYVPVSVAFWVKPAESDNLFLYVGSDDISDANVAAAYGEVMRRMSQDRTPALDPFQIKLVNSSDPIARDAMEIRDRYRRNRATQLQDSLLGGLGIEGAYIYPPLAAMTSNN